MKKFKLILASGSPRRKELISWIGIPFEIIVSDVDENSDIKDPKELVTELARQKGCAVVAKCADSVKDACPIVVSSDTIVCLEKKIYGKPGNINEARQMLSELSGKTHTVFTSVCIQYENNEVNFVGESKVEFLEILPDVMEHYLSTNDSLDKAGAYGIQGQALTFIKGINGSYSNVVGFPLSEFIMKLKEIAISEGTTDWRSCFV